MTLALLITAVGGAWAQWTGGTYTATANENLGAITVGADATLTINEGVTVTVSGGINANGHTLTVNGAGTLIVTGTNGAWGANGGMGDGGDGSNGSAGFTGTLIVDGATVNVTGGNGGNGGGGLGYGGNGGNGAAGVSGSITLNSGSVTVTGGAGGNGGMAGSYDGSRGSAGQAVTETITASTAEESDDNSTWTAISGNTSSKRYVRADSTAPAVEVTINEAKTEASFKMPQYDVTATYTLKRDLSVETQVTVGDDHSAQPRYRVQKQGDTFVPVGLTNEQVMALFHVHDQIEDEDLAPVQDYTVEIYAVDIEGQPTGDAITFQNFTYAPGQYIVKAVGQGNYVGQTLESNVFTLFQGYPVEIAAQSFATYYSDEALTLDESETAAGLYTISSVTDNAAVVSEKIQVAPANTPLLVYNESEEARNILLIPTTDEASTVSVASEFKGTLTEQEMSASSDAVDYYVLNGSSFVWVKNAGTIAANRCWLQLAKGAATARTLPLVFDDATGINAIGNADLTTGSWYDLNGRKLTRKPAAKGVYILNGRKVVVK